jgi:threonine dehydratase
VPVSLDDIRAAAQRISGAVEHTPCVHSRTLSQLTGAEVFLKFENLQFTASFKERGALNKLLSLGAAERRRGVIAMSAGNHAQAVAYHAARLGIPATIVMPRGSPNSKIKNTQVHGATVVLEGDNLFEAGKRARELAARDDLVFVHPYEDPFIIAGQGTVGLEMLAAVPDLELIVVPVGGGGLIAAVAAAVKDRAPQARIVAVQPEASPSLRDSIRQGKALLEYAAEPTLADGLAGGIGEIVFAHRDLLDEVVVVPEKDIEDAIVALIAEDQVVAEGAGAVGVAALRAGLVKSAEDGRPVIAIVTGGNIDAPVLARLLQRRY